jgi:hypothetical protein
MLGKNCYLLRGGNYILSSEFLKKLLNIPLRQIGPRAISYFRRRNSYKRQRACDYSNRTYSSFTPLGAILRFIKIDDVSKLQPLGHQIADLSSLYINHRFDLLGSGWIQVRYGMSCPGIELYRYFMPVEDTIDRADPQLLLNRINSSNLAESQRVWSLVTADYVPIDWQLDFKSGYRWSENTWAQDVPFGHLPGVDIKIPWELARLQHLPQLAIAYRCAVHEAEWSCGFRDQKIYLREFRNVVLDFVGLNPPRFGVNWRSAMDVAIRAANILLAYDIFRSGGAVFDNDFDSVLKKSMIDHGEFIIENFEWKNKPHGNHYLAHVTGLLFISSYLPSSPVVDAWLALSIQEFISEAMRQFNPDGSNFEGSTSYHRLSGEMLIYGTALILGLPIEKLVALQNYDNRLFVTLPHLLHITKFPLEINSSNHDSFFPECFRERIELLAQFTMHITKHSGDVVQIGDNDSGHFFRLFPSYVPLTLKQASLRYKNLASFNFCDWPSHWTWWDENILDHRNLVGAASGLIRRTDFIEFSGDSFERNIIEALSNERYFGKTLLSSIKPFYESQPSITSKPNFELCLDYPGTSLRSGIRQYSYPDFGVYIFISHRLFLSVRCGPIGQEGNGGHAHNDQLSIELEVDGVPVFTDPGSYVYTALPKLRNQYRSDLAHFSFRSTVAESGGLNNGLFEIKGDPKARCLNFDKNIFVGEHYGFGPQVLRSISVGENSIKIYDWVKRGAFKGEIIPFYACKPIASELLLFSNGYGKVIA